MCLFGNMILASGAPDITKLEFTGSSVVFGSGTQLTACCYDSTNSKIVIVYRNTSGNTYGYAIVGTVSGNTISFGSAVVFAAVSIDYPSCCYDSTNNRVVVSYTDAGNSNYGKAVVGTVSGNAISFGSPTTYNSGATYNSSCAYDSANNRTVIIYNDGGNSYYGTAIVGTVSNTSISFGSEVVFNTSYTDYTSCCFDTTNNKVVVSWSGTSQYGTAIVGTVSNTSISFGSPTIFNSGATSIISSCYDSTNSKVIISYRDIANSDYGTAIVGTVSNTSISFGSEVVFNAGGTTDSSCCYDSTNGKVIVVFRDVPNSNYGTAIVGTVANTSISFGAEVVFNTGNITYVGCRYDIANNKVVIVYFAHTGDTRAIVGTPIE